MVMVYKEKQKGINEDETTPKKKAREEEEVETMSKVAKRCDLEVVPYEEPPKKYKSNEVELSRGGERLDNSNFEENAS